MLFRLTIAITIDVSNNTALEMDVFVSWVRRKVLECSALAETFCGVCGDLLFVYQRKIAFIAILNEIHKHWTGKGDVVSDTKPPLEGTWSKSVWSKFILGCVIVLEFHLTCVEVIARLPLFPPLLGLLCVCLFICVLFTSAPVAARSGFDSCNGAQNKAVHFPLWFVDGENFAELL